LSDVIDFHTGQPVTPAQRRADREAYATQTASALEAAIARLEKANYSSLPNPVRAQLARNLGAIAASRAEDHGLSVRVLMKQAWFSAWPPESNASGGPVFERRKRLVRYSDAELADAEPFVAEGKHYVTLARAFVARFPSKRLSAAEDLSHVMHWLLAGARGFDPDPAREALTDIGGVSASRAALVRFREELLRKCPNLPAYFAAIAAQRLCARPLARDEWETTDDGKLVADGQAADHLMFAHDAFDDAEPLEAIQRGELAPERLYDGFLLNNAVAGVAATWPRVTLGRLSLARRAGPSGTATASWILQIALAPMGSARLDDLNLVLLAHPDGFTGDDHDSPEGPSIVDQYAFWKTSDLYLRLSLSEAAVWSVQSGDAQGWLGLKLTPEQYLPQAMADPKEPTVAVFEPTFTAPAEFAGGPANTLGGMIERNLIFAPDPETLREQLSSNAKQRMTALNAHLKTATHHYSARKRAFFSDKQERADD
jgi:hypothetical protein